MSPLAKRYLTLYEHGYFPMADDAGRVGAFCYDPRGLLPVDEFHVPRRLERWLRASPYKITYNQAFAEVIQQCAARTRTWINGEIEQAFCELHKHGWAHSLEAWQDDRLVGGLYGLALGGTFCGESMFHAAPHAGKACLIELHKRMIHGGFDLLDCQDVTPTLAQFGARQVRFSEYYRLFRLYREKVCTLHHG